MVQTFYTKFFKTYETLYLMPKEKKIIDISNKDYQEAFQKSKELISNLPILSFPDFSKPFILTTDASNYAISSVLSQVQDNVEKPLAYASKTFNNHEQNYSTVEKELKSIVFSVQNFRSYLYGTKFTIRTDHRPLIWLYNMRNGNQKVMRWKIELSEYNFDIEYLPGRTNKIADYLSRIREPFKIKYVTGDVTETNIFCHCVSKDNHFSKGLALQIDEQFASKKYCENNYKDQNMIIQNFENKTILHLYTKDTYKENANVKQLKSCLITLRDYLIKNDLFEINMPYLS